MKAARLHRIGEKLRIDEILIPKVGPDDVLIRIRASGICGSDLHYRNGVIPVGKLPITLGHEIAGVIAEVGDNVNEVKRGDRVCVHYVISCGNCAFCAMGKENLCERYQMIGKHVNGGFAEYLKAPAKNVLKLPDSIPFEQGAIMGCAVSTPFHALRRAKTSEGSTVMIYGVGGLGMHAVQLSARIFGAGKVIAVDVSREKLDMAEEVGADETVNAVEEDPVKRVMNLTHGRGADVVIDFVGHRETIERAIKCVGKGGRVVVVGMGAEDIRIFPYQTLIAKEMEIIDVNDHLKPELAQLIELVRSGKVDLSKSITHRVSLDDVNKGMELLEKKIGNPIRVVIIQ